MVRSRAPKRADLEKKAFYRKSRFLPFLVPPRVWLLGLNWLQIGARPGVDIPKGKLSARGRPWGPQVPRWGGGKQLFALLAGCRAKNILKQIGHKLLIAALPKQLKAASNTSIDCTIAGNSNKKNSENLIPHLSSVGLPRALAMISHGINNPSRSSHNAGRVRLEERMVEVRKNKRGKNKEVRRNQTHNLPAGDKLLERQWLRKCSGSNVGVRDGRRPIFTPPRRSNIHRLTNLDTKGSSTQQMIRGRDIIPSSPPPIAASTSIAATTTTITIITTTTTTTTPSHTHEHTHTQDIGSLR